MIQFLAPRCVCYVLSDYSIIYLCIITAGLDFEALNETVTLNVSSAGTTIACVSINVTDDVLAEPDVEDLSVVVSSPLLASQPNLTILIHDNDMGKFYSSYGLYKYVI